MRDILQSRYLHSNVAHKQLARTSLNKSEAEQNWTLMGDLRIIGPKNVFLSITWEPIVPNSERHNLVLWVRFGNYRS